MTAESIARCRLDANVGPAMDAGVTIEQVQNILVSRRRAGATITPRSGQCRCFDRG
jgi:hypothetical protein